MGRETDVDDAILAEQVHRPGPLPAGPWIMRQTWHDLMFAHWPVPRSQLRAKVPGFLDIETFDNEAWVGIAPFWLSNVTARWLPPLPWVSTFNEINLRTYVSANGVPGVYFFSLDASSVLAVQGASTFFHLPYFHASISVSDMDGRVTFSSSRTRDAAAFRASYGPATRPKHSQKGTLEYFLTERYCLYTTDSSGNGYRVDVHHRPWPLQRAEGEVQTNTIASAAGIDLPSTLPLLHFSRRLDVLTWPPHRIS